MLRSISISIFLIGVSLSCFTAAFITELSTKPWISKRSGSHTLFGVPEWKAKFSSSTNSTSLPLLMFPFEPTQIPLPGQHAKITFRHGKYMDMIDESLTSYESVVGMSVLYQDRLLPIVVVCEVIEEELDIKSGYRGFSSMEVGFRAIGRMEWVDTQSEQDVKNISDVFHGRKPLTDIQLGQFIDYEDADLSDAGIDSCRQYLKNIETLLALPSNFLTRPRDHQDIDEQQQLYSDAYTYLSSKIRDVSAASWALFTLLDDDSKISSVIIQALSTTNAAERLRLGLAAFLDRTSSSASDEYTDNNAFQ